MENTRPRGHLLRPNTIANSIRANLASNLNLNGIGSDATYANRRAALSRRSKSFADFNRRPLFTGAPSSFPANSVLNKPISTINNKKPIINQVPTTRRPLAPRQLTTITTKRKAEPPISSVSSLKSARVPAKPANVKPTTSAAPPTKTIAKKPAPYDYKARFQLLQEKHQTLKSDHKEISDKYNKLNEDMAKYMEDSEQLKLKEQECHLKQTEIDKLKQELNVNKDSFNQCQSQLHQIQTDFDKQKSVLEECQQKFAEINKTYENLKSITDQLKDENLQLKAELTEKEQNIDQLVNQVFDADNERRRLHNVIQDLKGNIRVFCRVRPQLEDEVGKHLLEISYQDECTIEVSNGATITGGRRAPKQEFSFNHVFGETSTQEQVFLELGQLVQSVLDGYNVCVFAYGQTGSGKTFTMEGGFEQDTIGMIPRTIDLLFKTIEERKILNWQYEVRASFLEIYNEQIYDLLNNDQLPHDIRMTDARGVDVYVTNLQIEIIESSDELKQLLYVAQRNRAVATTVMNERSSRSHAVTKIEVIGTNTTSDETFHASLNLVDLAGSERARDSEMIRLNETKNINKSLANLSNVILALLQKKDHIPYRDSKLTHLLMPSLGGNSKTLMFVNISPLTECYNETLNSLRFAAKVNSCKVANVRKNRIM